MPSVRILTGAHLARNPRVVKEATALAGAGYEVTVLAPAFTAELVAEDADLADRGRFRVEKYCDLRPGRSGRFRARAERRLGSEACRRLGWQSARALGYGVPRMQDAARAAPADLVIGHQEVGAWAATQLGRRSARVGVDFEDWYSEDLLPQARAGRPLRLLRECERWLQQYAAHATAPSSALAAALAGAYGGPPPRVVYNAFPWADRDGLPATPAVRTGRPTLHWVSQTIGRGRGLEALFAALGRVKTPVDVHLRGACSAETAEWLTAAVPAHLGHTLTVHPLIPNRQLLPAIAAYDIGLALEQDTPPNHDLTVSNKILHYLLAGLAVVASGTAGQREIAAGAGAAVRVFPPDDSAGLAAALTPLVEDPGELTRARAVALVAARERYCWERQVPVLLDSVRDAVGRPPGAARGGPPGAADLEPAGASG